MVSEVNVVSTFPEVAPSSIQSAGGALVPDFGLSHVTFDHTTGYLWTGVYTGLSPGGHR